MYLKVMEGTKSNANRFEYKVNEVNIAENWNPKANNPKEFGGFNFSTEDKILRWVFRGDTIYDVEIPKDAEVVEVPNVNTPHGVFRTNKIIISNPRKITDDLIIELYKKSRLPENTYYQCLVTLLFKNHKKAVEYIIKDRINKSNASEAIKEFEQFISSINNKKFEYQDLWEDAKKIYIKLKDIERK